jgi:hypothetical protein
LFHKLTPAQAQNFIVNRAVGSVVELVWIASRLTVEVVFAVVLWRLRLKAVATFEGLLYFGIADARYVVVNSTANFGNLSVKTICRAHAVETVDT